MEPTDFEEQIVEKISGLDIRSHPRLVEDAARLLRQSQEHRTAGTRLAAQMEKFLRDASDGGVEEARRSLADRAEDVLLKSDGPRHYREIADEIQAAGFQHSRVPKSPKQLADSVWTAMYDDSKQRFRKVGRGVWDLASRHADSEAAGAG